MATKAKVMFSDPIPPSAEPKYYRIEVNSIFDYAQEHFQPGPIYHVREDIYNGKLEDGTSFKSLCVKAEEEGSKF